MKLGDVVDAVRKRYWIILVLILVASLIAAVAGYVQSPVYKVEITMAAIPPTNPTTQMPDPTIGAAYIAAMPSIANASESIGVAETVQAELLKKGIDIPAEELMGKVSALPEENSNAFKLTFTDSSPTRVADIANTWGTVLALKTLPPSEGIPNELYDPGFSEVIFDGTLRITSTAVPPDTPTQPKPLLYIGLGAFLGLILGFCIVVLIEYFDPHFRSPSEVEENLEAPVVGLVPKTKARDEAELLSSLGETSPIWDAYSELRTGLMFSSEEGSMRSIAVAAAIPFGTGPSASINLAMSIAAIERSTLLIDCDMGGQAVSRLMGCSNRPGLSDSIKGGKIARDSIVKTEVRNLSILPAGTPYENSSDLLSRPLFEDILGELESYYDKVILYAPSLSSSVDASIIASKTDSNLVVIDADKCTRRMAAEALKSYERLHLKPDGVILTNVKMKRFQRKQQALKSAEKARVRTEVGMAAGIGSLQEGMVKERGKKRVEKAGAAREPKEVKAAPPVAEEPPGAPKPEPSKLGMTEEEIERMRTIVAEDFRRLGETGAPIPRQWLRALNSDKVDVRESAEIAIDAYYQAFLLKYKISEESIKNIAASIIRMMRREGEFAGMSEEEAQKHLRKMLVDAGARFSGASSGSSSNQTANIPGEQDAGGEAEAGEKQKDAGKGRRDEETGDHRDSGPPRQPHPEKDKPVDWE